jgi:hypothetical protein
MRMHGFNSALQVLLARHVRVGLPAYGRVHVPVTVVKQSERGYDASRAPSPGIGGHWFTVRAQHTRGHTIWCEPRRILNCVRGPRTQARLGIFNHGVPDAGGEAGAGRRGAAQRVAEHAVGCGADRARAASGGGRPDSIGKGARIVGRALDDCVQLGQPKKKKRRTCVRFHVRMHAPLLTDQTPALPTKLQVALTLPVKPAEQPTMTLSVGALVCGNDAELSVLAGQRISADRWRPGPAGRSAHVSVCVNRRDSSAARTDTSTGQSTPLACGQRRTVAGAAATRRSAVGRKSRRAGARRGGASVGQAKGDAIRKRGQGARNLCVHVDQR